MPLHLLTAGTDPNGTLFGIDTDGMLRWYQYTWNSDPDVAAGLAPWLKDFAPNSGNPIGVGWGEFAWIGAGVKGTLLGVDGHGVLHRYYYTGNGERDDGGDLNWAPQSGAPLMTFDADWVQFALTFDRILPGPEGEDIALVAVNSAGELWIYLFHDGVARPNSPVLLATGWSEYRYVFGGLEGLVFAVDSAGVLYEFGVAMAFHADRTFTAELAGGNAIGKGWSDFSRACSCAPGDSTATQAIYAVDSGHNLRWFGYTGGGASDPDGANGWAPGSGTIISGSW